MHANTVISSVLTLLLNTITNINGFCCTWIGRTVADVSQGSSADASGAVLSLCQVRSVPFVSHIFSYWIYTF